jgi:hypothetical protein
VKRKDEVDREEGVVAEDEVDREEEVVAEEWRKKRK